MLDRDSCYAKVADWMYQPGGHGMYAYMFVGLSHSADDLTTVEAGTCYAGLWYERPDEYPSSVGGVGLDASTAEVPAAAPPAPYGQSARDLCSGIYGSSSWVLYSSPDTAICSDSNVNATRAPGCSDLGIDDSNALPDATPQELLSLPVAAYTLCLEQSDGDASVPIGRPSSTSSTLFNDLPGNLPYPSCSDYAASTDSVVGWVSLNRRTACRAGWLRAVGVVIVPATGYVKVGTALFDFVESAAINQTYEFTTTMVITTVHNSMQLKNGSLDFASCSLCGSVNSTSSVTGTDMSTTATFTVPAANAAGSYTVSSWAASSFDVRYDWNPIGLYTIRSGPQFDLPTWRCTSNGYVNQTWFEGAMYVGPSGCVFPWAAGLMNVPATVLLGGDEVNMTTINNHMTQAQQSGLPGAAGSGTYLHYLADKTLQKDNRDTACPNSLDRPIGYQCDEYPFSSSWEGAALTSGGPRSVEGCGMSDPDVSGPDGFSRCFVPEKQNSAQGSIIAATISADQLLDGDPYQVRIATT